MNTSKTETYTLELSYTEYVALRVACRTFLKLSEKNFGKNQNPPHPFIKAICGAYGELVRSQIRK